MSNWSVSTTPSVRSYSQPNHHHNQHKSRSAGGTSPRHGNDVSWQQQATGDPVASANANVPGSYSAPVALNNNNNNNNNSGVRNRNARSALGSSNVSLASSSGADSQSQSAEPQPQPRASTSNSTAFVCGDSLRPLAAGRKYVGVYLLTHQRLYVNVEAKSCRVRDVFASTCAHLQLQQTSFFGLTRIEHNEHRFVDDALKVAKCAPKAWKQPSTPCVDANQCPSVIFHLRVKIYVEFITLIRCHVSLHHYYLQLRENARGLHWSQRNCVSDELCFHAASLALQADFGDEPTPVDLRLSEYFPRWVVEKRGPTFIQQHLPQLHAALHGTNANQARRRYCTDVCRMCCCPLNTHIYMLRRNKSDAQENAALVIETRGLQIVDVNPTTGDRRLAKALVWSQIAKLSFEKRRFLMIGLDESRCTYFAESDEKARYLLQLCRAVHQTLMALNNDICEARKVEMSELRDSFRESYVGGREEELLVLNGMQQQPQQQQQPANAYGHTNGHVLTGVSACEQRTSMVSDVSSGTTSGIVSDRLHINDDSDIEPGTSELDSSPLISELSLCSPGLGLYTQQQQQQYARQPDQLYAQPGNASVGLHELSLKLPSDFNTAQLDRLIASAQMHNNYEHNPDELEFDGNGLRNSSDASVSSTAYLAGRHQHRLSSDKTLEPPPGRDGDNQTIHTDSTSRKTSTNTTAAQGSGQFNVDDELDKISREKAASEIGHLFASALSCAATGSRPQSVEPTTPGFRRYQQERSAHQSASQCQSTQTSPSADRTSQQLTLSAADAAAAAADRTGTQRDRGLCRPQQQPMPTAAAATNTTSAGSVLSSAASSSHSSNQLPADPNPSQPQQPSSNPTGPPPPQPGKPTAAAPTRYSERDHAFGQMPVGFSI